MSTSAKQIEVGKGADTGEDLPEGWADAILDDISEPPQYGWTTSARNNGAGLKLLRTTDISGGEVDWERVPACDNEPERPGKYLLKPGDIVVSRAGSVGLSYLVESPHQLFLHRT